MDPDSMTVIDDVAAPAPARTAIGSTAWLFALTVFVSAGLVFLVEPMIAKMVLPRLGGSPAVWNTSLAFFQVALLAGYFYAHMLQRIRTVRVQAVIHIGVLLLAALALPLRINGVFGESYGASPVLWLLGVLTVSVGAPFAALSATAPLVQAWYSRSRDNPGAANPYVLYAASNLGSLLALLAYPLVVEPSLTLRVQTLGWSLGFAGFICLMGALAVISRRGYAAPVEARNEVASVTWRERLTWLGLSAVPSALMMGVTTHISSDVAAFPLLWVLPLTLYLLTFIIAFQARPLISPAVALLVQAAAAAACAACMHPPAEYFLFNLGLTLAGFFLTALVCHQALAARRPAPARLTEFYLWMSVGGVVGGGFCAFLAPVIFNNVYEYPLALVLAGLARPWGRGRLSGRQWAGLAIGIASAVAAVALTRAGNQPVANVMLGVATVCCFLLRERAVAFTAMVAAVCISALMIGQGTRLLESDRSFFGVSRITHVEAPGIGPVRLMEHGTTLHGAQAEGGPYRCRAMAYYGALTPIGQAFDKVLARGPGRRIGAIGMGAGAVASRGRAGDTMRFFEIDPVVARLATDPRWFTFINGCAKGRVDYVLGDARIELARQPRGQFDLLLVDAFSSDSVPAHLLTVEAMRMYLDHVAADGVVVMHLSNRNLELKGPVAATARAAGAYALEQQYLPAAGAPPMLNAPEEAVVFARSPAALARFAADRRWKPANERGAKPWTDDYTNIVGALVGRIREPSGVARR